MNMDAHRKKRHRIIETAIWNVVESLKRSWTFFVTACQYMKASLTITSFFGSFSIDSSNRVKSAIRASKKGGDVASFVEGKGSRTLAAFPFPLTVVGTRRGACLAALHYHYPSLGGWGTIVALRYHCMAPDAVYMEVWL